MRRADTPGPSPSQSIEDYLERIQELIETKGYARPIEIAAALGIHQSSVTRMMRRLHDLGYARYEKHRGLVLTESGRQVALAIQDRHRLLERFFRMIGVEGESLEEAIEGIEHHLAEGTLKRLEAFVAFLEQRPGVMEDFHRMKDDLK